MKLYRQKEWAAYRREQIKLHGGECAHCLRGADEVDLQVHHEKYVKGLLPWEGVFVEVRRGRFAEIPRQDFGIASDRQRVAHRATTVRARFIEPCGKLAKAGCCEHHT